MRERKAPASSRGTQHHSGLYDELRGTPTEGQLGIVLGFALLPLVPVLEWVVSWL